LQSNLNIAVNIHSLWTSQLLLFVRKVTLHLHLNVGSGNLVITRKHLPLCLQSLLWQSACTLYSFAYRLIKHYICSHAPLQITAIHQGSSL